MPKAFLVDTTRCTACRGCQLACKEWHDLPANETKQRGSHQNPPDLNPNNYKIVRFHEHLDKQGNVVWNFFPDQCRHCVTPICVDVADMAVPGAMIKDPKTGAVLVTDKIKKLSEQARTEWTRILTDQEDPEITRLFMDCVFMAGYAYEKELFAPYFEKLAALND